MPGAIVPPCGGVVAGWLWVEICIVDASILLLLLFVVLLLWCVLFVLVCGG